MSKKSKKQNKELSNNNSPIQNTPEIISPDEDNQELINKLKQSGKLQGKFSVGAIEVIEVIRSPIPPPEIMEKYNAMMPSAMEKFFSLAEKQSAHRMEIEKIHVQGQQRRATLGVYAAWSLAVIFGIIGAMLIYFDKSIEGFTAFGLALIPRIISFFTSRKEAKKQLEKHK